MPGRGSPLSGCDESRAQIKTDETEQHLLQAETATEKQDWNAWSVAKSIVIFV